ncbi:MAG TPA: hypothetical protein VIK55_17030 [Paludibacter sp.]
MRTGLVHGGSLSTCIFALFTENIFVLDEVSFVFIGYNLSRLIMIAEGVNALKELIKGIIALLWWKRNYFKPI